MGTDYNATCDICGKRYRVCKTCREIKSFTPWRTITDTFEHYRIFLILSEYTRDKNAEKAKAQLDYCDLSELDTFNDNIKKAINEIYTKTKPKEDAELPKVKTVKKTRKVNKDDE